MSMKMCMPLTLFSTQIVLQPSRKPPDRFTNKINKSILLIYVRRQQPKAEETKIANEVQLWIFSYHPIRNTLLAQYLQRQKNIYEATWQSSCHNGSIVQDLHSATILRSTKEGSYLLLVHPQLGLDDFSYSMSKAGIISRFKGKSFSLVRYGYLTSIHISQTLP